MRQIKYSELENYEIITQLAGCFGKGEHKSIDMVVIPSQKKVWFIVYSNRKEIGSMPDLKDAIDLFNDL